MQRKEIIGDCTLYLGDSFDLVKEIKADCCITDPPYGISYKSPSGKGKTIRGNYDIIKGDDVPFNPEPFLKFDQVVLFGANHFANKLPNSAKWLVWDKRAGMTPNNNSDCELAWVKNGGSARLITHLWNGMLKDSEKDQQRVHPTQKPIAVMEWVLKQTTEINQSVFDPFMGSGSTSIACIRQKRKFIGIELDEKYFDIACKRIEEAYKQPDMFIEPPTKYIQDKIL